MQLFKKWWMSWQWLIIPAIVLISVELWVRHNFDEISVWYSAAGKVAAMDRIDVAFIGSSRVREGVSVPIFQKEVSRITGQCPHAVNLGLGYSTPAEHYFGLRNLFASRPGNMKGVTLFIEATGGLPAQDRWEDRWVHASQPQLIVDLLRVQDLPRFWMSRGNTADDKVHLTLRASLLNLSTFNRRERVRASLEDGGGLGWMLSFLSSGDPVAAVPDNRNFGLMGSGGTKTDSQSVSTARRLAVEYSQDMMEHESRLHDWRTTIISDIVDLVHKNGGHIVFFDVPLSTPFKRVFTTPTRQQDILQFRNQASSWDGQILTPQVQYTDDDLPDFWHAGHDLAERYTRELADAWTRDVPANWRFQSASATCPGR